MFENNHRIKLSEPDGYRNYYPKFSKFPGGEVNVRLPDTLPSSYEGDIFLKGKLQSSDDILALCLVVDALKRLYANINIVATIPYFPYARQDRVCNKGEALSAKVMADIINSLGFKRVYVYDCHSDVSTALINNCVNVPPKQILDTQNYTRGILRGGGISLVCPDAGAMKKTLDVAKTFLGLDVVQCDKVRDTRTGEILKTVVHAGDLKGKDMFIVDDICDGGRTFIEIAKRLREHNCGKIYLYVTHGIFSKGIEVFDELIDEIITTHSFKTDIEHEKLIKIGGLL